jgi:type IV pilus biogenesis protein CpaD/CtpE
MAIFFSGWQKIAPLQGRMAYLTLVLLVIVTAGLVGCATTPISTPKGASSVTVTSTSGGVSKTTTVNINVN